MNLAFVGNGAPHFAAAFAEDFAPGQQVLSDPSTKSYDALGFGRIGLARALSPKAMKAAARALKGGHRQTKTLGDAWQLGGVVVVLPDREVVYSYTSEFAGDHPELDEVMQAVRSVGEAQLASS